MKRAFQVVLLVFLAGAAYFAWSIAFPKHEYFEIVIKIQTPDGVKEGRTVVELIGYHSPVQNQKLLKKMFGGVGEFLACGGSPCTGYGSGKMRGRAPIVELGEKGRIVGSLGWWMVDYLGSVPPGTGPFDANTMTMVWVPHGAKHVLELELLIPNGARKRSHYDREISAVLGKGFGYISTVIARVSGEGFKVPPPPDWAEPINQSRAQLPRPGQDAPRQSYFGRAFRI